jgi:alkylation response protein AidB-like acyl-CoA dehydrogenase
LPRPVDEIVRTQGQAKLRSWSKAVRMNHDPVDDGGGDVERSQGEQGTDAFRAELRDWLADHLTPEIIEAGSHPVEAGNLEVLREWNRTLADGRWAAPSWPAEHGGRGAGVAEQLAYLEETSRARCPGPVNVIGVSNIAPAIMHWGTPGQQRRFLQPMLRGDEIWSQGMSEPDAGSDLASLRTTAVEDGEDFLISGQKTWNSLGHLADWCQLYVRTDPTAKKHAGITCFLVDLRTPGVQARPLTTMTGGHSFAELFFTDARVPRSAMLGPLHQGWSVAMTTLGHERAGVARLHLSLANRLDDVLADPRARDGLRDPLRRQRVARVYASIRCMRFLTERSLSDPAASGAGGSLAKLLWAQNDQELADVAVDLIGLSALGAHDRWADNLLAVRQASIAGGTTEINKNIVGEHVLGLPR